VAGVVNSSRASSQRATWAAGGGDFDEQAAETAIGIVARRMSAGCLWFRRLRGGSVARAGGGTSAAGKHGPRQRASTAATSTTPVANSASFMRMWSLSFGHQVRLEDCART